MPRTARASVGNMCYHVLNRGNGRAEVFHKPADYAAFLQLMAEANERVPMRILGYALMPHHFHLALWLQQDGDLSRWRRSPFPSQELPRGHPPTERGERATRATGVPPVRRKATRELLLTGGTRVGRTQKHSSRRPKIIRAFAAEKNDHGA